MVLKQLLGHWTLIKMSAISEDGDEIFPIGQNVRGLLTYAANGIMSAQIGSTMRPNFIDPDYRNGSTDEIIEAFNGYISYFGKYSVHEERKFIIHDVEMSLFPNWVSTKVKRYYELDMDMLILKATPISYDGILRTPTLVWKKL